MSNPASLELAARDRIAEIQRTAAKRSLGTRSHLAAATTNTETPTSSRHARRANPQRAVGWFLVSVGLRLALPRARTGSGR
jgi:hypothetical protein